MFLLADFGNIQLLIIIIDAPCEYVWVGIWTFGGYKGEWECSHQMLNGESSSISLHAVFTYKMAETTMYFFFISNYQQAIIIGVCSRK